MRILNVRLGHACNSSSSHSLVLLPGAKDDYWDSQQFGWENFTLASPKAKLDYLSQQIFQVIMKSYTSMADDWKRGRVELGSKQDV